MAWTRRQILGANIYLSMVNFLTPIAIAWIFSVELLSIWVSGRAFTQFFIAFFPTQAHAFVLFSKPLKRNRLYLFFSGFYLNVVVSVSSISVYFFLFFDEGTSLTARELVLFLSYLCVFGISGYLSLLPRIQKRSDLQLYISKVDASITAVSLVFAVVLESFPWLILFFLVKDILKCLIILKVIGIGWRFEKPKTAFASSYSFSKFSSIFFSCSLIHVFRSVSQVLMQHGDRFLLPLIFGFNVGGQAALGSSIAMIPVMLSSSAFAWSLPLVMGGQNKVNYIYRQLFLIAAIVLLMTFVLLIILWFFESRNDFVLPFNLSIVSVASFLLASVVGSSFLLFALEKKHFLNVLFFVKIFVFLSSIYLSIYFCDIYYSFQTKNILAWAAICWIFVILFFVGSLRNIQFVAACLLFLTSALVVIFL